MEVLFTLAAFVAGCFLGFTANRIINQPALEQATLVCQTNQGVQSVVTSTMGNSITANCLNGAVFVIDNNMEKKK